MLTWQADDGRALEGARLILGTGHPFRVLSRLVRIDPDGDYTATYRLSVYEDGTVARLSVESATANRERLLTLNRTEDGDWLLDTGSGGTRSDFAGAVDVDIVGSLMFSALPIRRLGLHREAGEFTVPVVRVVLPTLEASRAEQTYRTVSVDPNGGAVVEVSGDDGTVELVVDADGLVVENPGVAKRVSAAPAAG